MRILVTGATGYVGGRLIPRLLQAGHEVRVLARDRARIQGRPWADRVEIAVEDLCAPGQLERALEGIDVAYYLVHSLRAGAEFAARDREAARNFVAAGGATGLRHVIYVGGLVPGGGVASRHLASRAEVGAILRAGLPTTEFQAGPIVGSGSASFEMVRYLTERVPAMVAPRWVLNEVQPIGIRDVLAYLIAALGRGPLGIVQVGGDRLSFREMMRAYAEVRGLRRLIAPVPVLAPRLAALWVGLVTPIPNSIAVPLVAGIVHPVLADTSRARELFPEIAPMTYREAMELALRRTREEAVETRWSGALGIGPTCELVDWEGTIREVRSLVVRGCAPSRVYRAFCGLGGDRGWLVWDWAWRLRGLIDKALGGPGLRRGRRHPEELLPGEALDFWRVENVRADHLLLLRAEMRLPGRAWLQYEAIGEGGDTRLIQTAIFIPDGFWGALYWYALYPFHRAIFSDLVEAVGRLAEGAGGGTPG